FATFSPGGQVIRPGQRRLLHDQGLARLGGVLGPSVIVPPAQLGEAGGVRIPSGGQTHDIVRYHCVPPLARPRDCAPYGGRKSAVNVLRCLILGTGGRLGKRDPLALRRAGRETHGFPSGNTATGRTVSG